MEQVGINGANQTFSPLSAGYATRNVAGAASVILATNEAASDFIELTGALTGNITVTVPTSIFPQVVGTSGAFSTSNSWLKLFKNSTTGAFSVTVQGPGGSGVVVPQGPALLLYSSDGIGVQAIAGGSVGGGAAASFVYSPSNPAPGPNVFTTWAALMAAFLILAADIPVTIYFDGSFAAGVCAIPGASGVSDLGGRTALRPVQHQPITAPVIVDIGNGASLKNVYSVSEVLTIRGNSAGASPSALTYDLSVCSALFIQTGAQFTNLGANPLITFAGGAGFFVPIVYNGTFIDVSAVGAGAWLGIQAGQTALCSFFNITSQTATFALGANSLVSGPAGTLRFTVDNSWGPTNPNTAAFAGVVQQTVQGAQCSKTIEILIPGAFTVTVPRGVKEALLEACGGGGGGGGGHGGQAVINGTSGAGGGGAQMHVRRIIGLTPGAVLNGVLGAGGAGGAAGAAGAVGGDGVAGVDTTFNGIVFSGGSGGKGATVGNASGACPFKSNAGTSLIDSPNNSLAANGQSISQGAGGRGGADGSLAFQGASQGTEALGGAVGAEGVGAGAVGHGGAGGGGGAYASGGAGGAGGATGAPGVAGTDAIANSGAGGGGGGGGGDAGQLGGAGGAGGSGRFRFTWVLSP